MFIDTHCHLTLPPLFEQIDSHLEAALQNGVTKIIVPSINEQDFNSVLSVARPNYVYPCLGIHPYFIDDRWQDSILELEKKIQQYSVVAIGEIGLDFYQGNLTPENKQRQIDVFTTQLKLAQKYQLPVLLHNRKSLYVTIELLKQYPVNSGIAHAFNGSLEEARILTQLNFKLGIGTMLCRPNTPKLAKLAEVIPNNAYVLETDSPDMPPIPNTINTPKNILLVAQKLAILKKQPLAQIALDSTKNTCQVLNLDQ